MPRAQKLSSRVLAILFVVLVAACAGASPVATPSAETTATITASPTTAVSGTATSAATPPEAVREAACDFTAEATTLAAGGPEHGAALDAALRGEPEAWTTIVESEIAPAYDRQLERLAVLASWESIREPAERASVAAETFVATIRNSTDEPAALADVVPHLTAFRSAEKEVLRALRASAGACD